MNTYKILCIFADGAKIIYDIIASNPRNAIESVHALCEMTKDKYLVIQKLS